MIFSDGLMGWPVLGAICVLGGIALVAIWLVPRRQAHRWAKQGITGKELAELETGARGTVVQILGGVALILTFVATWMQISDTRKATDRTLRLTADQQQSERFTRSVEQLASRRSEIRIGGIYALEGVAAESPVRRGPVAQILLSYLQYHHRGSREDGTPINDIAEDAKRAVQSEPWPRRICDPRMFSSVEDKQAALNVVVGVADAARPRFKLQGLDLRAVGARGADLKGANLSGSYLTFADLVGARFDGALLRRTNFTKTCLQRASFVGARLIGTVFDGADLRGVDFRGTKFTISASFRFSSLRRANLRRVDLSSADLHEVDLSGADLRGADLSGTSVRKDRQLEGARVDACTRLPWRDRVPKICPSVDGYP